MAEIPPRGKNLIVIREVPVFMETGTSFAERARIKTGLR